jgi:acetylornithine deacetylase/succinyl-diaminopimelate desuccinylase-like protein
MALSPLAGAASALDYARRATVQRRWLADLTHLLSFPTVSALPQHRPDIERAAAWLAGHAGAIGLRHAQVLGARSGATPSVYADWLLAPGRPTVLFYGHFDVQPAEPLRDWRTPPFRATLDGNALIARGASDDKGQLFIHLKALESYLHTGGALPVNVKVWLEGEEEIKSPGLAPFLDREARRLRTDAVLISDTEMRAPGRPTIIYGLRGTLPFDIQVSGPIQDIHSGRYGGAVHNPAQALAEIIAKLHDADGHILLPGFYRRVREPSPSERRELYENRTFEHTLATTLQLPGPWGEPGWTSFERVAVRPALTVNGMQSGYVGPGGKSSIPGKALAQLSFRLVPDQDPAEIAALLQRHIAAISPPSVRVNVRVGQGTRPVLISRRHPVMAAAARAVYRTWGVPPTFSRSGGSIGAVDLLHRRLGVPVVLLGFGLPDDNIHGPNEKLDLPNFFQGVETIIRFLAEYEQ